MFIQFDVKSCKSTLYYPADECMGKSPYQLNSIRIFRIHKSWFYVHDDLQGKLFGNNFFLDKHS